LRNEKDNRGDQARLAAILDYRIRSSSTKYIDNRLYE